MAHKNNEDNLINLSTRSEEDRKRIARMGGIASGETRRQNATMRKTLETLLNSKNNKGTTYQELATLGLIKGAIDGKAENYKIMLMLMGELEQEKSETPTVEINIVDNTNLEKTLYEEDK